jgi:RHS repeat-associated protein
MRNVAYQYDPVGNRQQVTDSGTGVSPVWYTANNLNQYTMVGGNNLSYDAKGNLQTVPGWTYQYDAQNRLLSVSSVSSVVQFSYDARNRCVARTVNGGTTYLIYDDWSLIAERDATGTQLAKYIHGATIDELLTRITSTNTVYYHHDGLGSTIALTDNTGSLAESYTYDVFGTPSIFDANGISLPSSIFANRFLYTGREYLADIGLYDYRNRFYSPWLGRFLQTDPIGFDAKDANLYRYVGNNVSQMIDPSGLECCPEAIERDTKNRQICLQVVADLRSARIQQLRLIEEMAKAANANERVACYARCKSAYRDGLMRFICEKSCDFTENRKNNALDLKLTFDFVIAEVGFKLTEFQCIAATPCAMD